MARKTVDNSQLMEELQQFRLYVEQEFKDIKPYIDTLRDIKSAGRVFAYAMGVLTAIATAVLLLKQLIPAQNVFKLW